MIPDSKPTELETVLKASLIYEKMKRERVKKKKLPPWLKVMSCDDWIDYERRLRRQNPHIKNHENDC